VGETERRVRRLRRVVTIRSWSPRGWIWSARGWVRPSEGFGVSGVSW